jgi:hypothetical protein
MYFAVKPVFLDISEDDIHLSKGIASRIFVVFAAK